MKLDWIWGGFFAGFLGGFAQKKPARFFGYLAGFLNPDFNCDVVEFQQQALSFVTAHYKSSIKSLEHIFG